MKVLIPIEDSLFGSAIAQFLGQHAWPDQTEFRVVTVVEPFYVDSDSHGPFASFLDSSADAYMSIAHRIVDETARLIQYLLPTAAVSSRVIKGPVVDEIISISKEWGADMIVAGSHGRSGFSRFFLGSVSLLLVSSAPCPVLLFKPDLELMQTLERIRSGPFVAQPNVSAIKRAEKSNCRILIPVDLTHSVKDLSSFIGKHCWQNPQFKLVNVVHTPGWTMLLSHLPEFETLHQNFMTESIESAKASLNHLAEDLKSYYPDATIEADVLSGNPKELILETATQWQSDLIIVGCHSGTTRQKFLLGSVSLAILCSAQCSVLLLRDHLRPICRKAESLESELAAVARANEVFR